MAHRVVIVGAGFAGLNAAKQLRHADATVTVIDRRNFHLFQPLLYQVATGALSPGEIASPIRNILHRQKNTSVLLAEVADLDPAAKRLTFADGATCDYDTLIIATGSTHHYFGHPEWEPLAPGLKTIENATEIRGRILSAFEMAEREADPARRAALMTFVIVGGGPTGVELAGALAEIANDTLRHDFRHIDPRDSHIYLIEGSPRLLPPFDPKLSAEAETALTKLGVRVHTKSVVTALDENGAEVKFPDKTERIEAKTIIWAAGVHANGLAEVINRRLGLTADKAGRVPVQPDLTVAGHPEIFVLGDMAAPANDKPWPGVAPVAIQQGAYAGKAILARLRGGTVQPFKYWDKGSLATIGRGAAAAQIGSLKFGGVLAWLAWLFIHLLYLVGYENRIVVFIEWSINYFTHNRTARLITSPAHVTPKTT
jgi:NADH dehydrogenase